MSNRNCCTTAVLALALMAAAPGTSRADLITNGDFSTGNFSGWTLFTTSNGSLGDGFFYPTVTLFDTAGTGTATTSAAFNVGKAQGGGQFPEEGGGLRQTITVSSSGEYTFSADIAVFSQSTNAEGGLFELLFDGNVVASEQFGFVGFNTTSRGTLSADLTGVSAGNHTVEILIERIYGAGPFSTPIQYVTGVSFSPATPEPVPEPSSFAVVGVALAGACGYGWRRKRAAA